MSNIPDYINKITELKSNRMALTQQVNTIDQELQAIYTEWQKECSHPVEYMIDNKCSACGYEIKEQKNADD